MDLKKKALYLSYFTVGYNIFEGAVSIVSGFIAGSVSLVGFGFDSLIESISGGVMIWRFSTTRNVTPEEEERIERKAEKLVAISFFILAAYVSYESVKDLLTHKSPDISIPGFVITILSVIIMPLLYLQKKKTGEQLGSKSLMADSKETLACFYLSVAVLAGLILNALFRWWWVDSAVGLVVVCFLIKEGLEAWRDECGCCTACETDLVRK